MSFISYYKIDKTALGENEHAQQFEKITQLNFKNINIFPSITLFKIVKDYRAFKLNMDYTLIFVYLNPNSVIYLLTYHKVGNAA